MSILLATLNARYAHASFGLRYLLANMGDLRGRTRIMEFDINQRIMDIAEEILRGNPRIVGIGVYIWNAAQCNELVALLKRIRPDLVVVLGGPEVSHETDQQEIVRRADYVITGEGDLAFAELCRKLLDETRPLGNGDGATAENQTEKILGWQGQVRLPVSHGQAYLPMPPNQSTRAVIERPPNKIIPATLPEFAQLQLPYDEYTEDDIRHRVIYVEASRGCPFRCEFCLSSLDVPVRNVPLDRFLPAMQRLLDRGVRHFKFVDRTFNLNLAFSSAILEFFLARYVDGLFLHFEMIPDRLPESLRTLIARFPAGSLQFEVGVQTFNEDAAQRISRRQDNAKVEENFRFLRQRTGVHIHADLIAGLPGEDLASFAAGFDRLVALGPQEIQLGILKRLRGTPIVRHDAEWEMVYSPHPPYEILRNKLIDFDTVQRLRRFARYWDLVANSGNFLAALPLVWTSTSPFDGFMRFSDWLYTRAGKRTHGFALNTLAGLLAEYLATELTIPRDEVFAALASDYTRTGRREVPEFLRGAVSPPPARRRSAIAARQQRHAGKGEGRR
ncbi:MAG: DUF4080 domain-containing protein [Tepidisphaerales bacterium]